MVFVDVRMRAKVIKKDSHPEHYGKVCTVLKGWGARGGFKAMVKFDDGAVATFPFRELRMGVKPSE